MDGREIKEKVQAKTDFCGIVGFFYYYYLFIFNFFVINTKSAHLKKQ